MLDNATTMASLELFVSPVRFNAAAEAVAQQLGQALGVEGFEGLRP